MYIKMNPLIIHDKFNIIKSDASNLITEEDISVWLEDVFFKRSTKNINNDLIHQYIYNNYFKKVGNVEQFVDKINIQLEKQICKRVKNILPKIKKGIFTFQHFDNILDDILTNIEEMNKSLYLINKHYDNLYPSDKNLEWVKLSKGKSVIYRKAINKVYNHFIENFVIKNFINNKIIELDPDNKKYIINLNNFVYSMKGYDESVFQHYLNNIVTTLSVLFKDDLDSSTKSVNIGIFANISQFNKATNMFEKINSYYSFLDDKLSVKLSISLCKYLSKVIRQLYSNKNNLLITLDFSLKNLDKLITVLKIMKNEYQTEYEYNKIINNLTSFITLIIESTYTKCQNNDNFIEFLKIYNSTNKFYSSLEDYVNINIDELYNNKLKNIFNKDKGLINQLCLILHNKIKHHNDDENLDFCLNILNLVKHVELDKDLFQATYCKYLIQRLLNKTNINTEKQLLTQLQEIEDYSYVRKMFKMIIDVETTYQDLDNFNKIKIEQKNNTLSREFKQNKLNLITFSYNVWNIAIRNNILDNKNIDDLPSQLKSYVMSYDKFYNKRYNESRQLLWLFDMGTVQIKFYNKNKEYKIRATPYQAILLELFSDSDRIPIDTINNNNILKKLDYKELTDIINSLVVSRLFTKTNDYLEFNTNFESSKEHISLIDFYKNISNYESIVNKQIEEQVAFDREIVLQTNIIHILKRNSLNLDELYNNIKDSQIKHFAISHDMLKTNIKVLLDKDFIECNNDVYSYLVY
jgi:hypothetical protein